MPQCKTKSGAVICCDLILKWKCIWSQVAAGLRSPFRQKVLLVFIFSGLLTRTYFHNDPRLHPAQHPSGYLAIRS